MSMTNLLTKRSRLLRWLVLILAIGAAIIGQCYFSRQKLSYGLVSYAASALFFVLLLILGRKQKVSELVWNKWLTILAVILIALGIAVRFYRLDVIPPGCWIDEAINGLEALDIIRTGRHQLVITSQRAAQSSLFLETLTIPFQLGIEPSALAVRAVAAIIGSIGIALYFLFLKAAFSPRVALIGTVFLAFSHWHNNYSRWGVEIIMSPTFQALGLWLLFSGFKRGKKWLFALSGAALGLGIYTYQNYRLFMVAMAFFALYLITFHMTTVKRHWQGLALFVFAALVVILPEGIFALSHPQTFSERALQTIVWLGVEGQPEVIRARLNDSISNTLLAFQYKGDENGRHNLPRAPLLTFVPAMFLPLGMLVCLSRFRRMEYALALLWFFFGILPGAITWEAPHASRLLDAISPIFIFAALGLEQVWITLEALWTRWGAKIAALLISAVLLITALANLNITFVLKPASQLVYNAFLPMESLAAERVREIGDMRDVLLSDKLFGSQVVRFIGWDAFRSKQHQIARLDPLINVPLRAKTGKDTSYLLDKEFTPFLPALRHAYPSGEEIAHRDPWGEVQFYEYRVSQQEISQVIEQGALQLPFGLEGSFYADAEGLGKPFLTRIFPFLRTDFSELLRPGDPFKLAVWRGTLTIPTSGNWIFTLNPANTSLQIGDKLVIPNMGDKAHEGSHDGAINLQAGEYPIEIRYTPARDSHAPHYRDIPRFLWFRWTAPGKGTEWVPSDMMKTNASAEAIVPIAEPARAIPAPAATPLPQQSVGLGAMQTWGSQGKGKGQFQEPRDVAIGRNGLIYVADTGNRRVQVFDANGEQKMQWTQADQPLVEPISIVVNSKGEILVLDIEPCYIYRFAENGDYLGKFAGPTSRLYKPRGMSIDAADNIYIADTGGCRIVKFDPSGKLIAEFGNRGSGPGQLLEPTDVAVISNGEMFVADGNKRIQHWNAHGEFIGEWPIPIANAYYGPHIAVAGDDTLFITAPELGQIWRYSANGELLAKWGGTELWRMPVELAIEGDKTLYVVAVQQHQILRVELSNP
jgi:4-amino-4-deoxy-L-arabinose transferase-like glycosyltransferase